MTYKKGGRVQLEGAEAAKRGKEMTEQIAAIAQVPGGLEMLMTLAAEELGIGEDGGAKKLRLYNMGGEVKEYQQGGLSQIMDQAQNVQAAGRGDDEMLLHVSPEEYDALTGMWGEPDINPVTGIPEYGFLSKLWKGIKKTVKKIVKSPLFSFVAPIALNVFAPGLGSAIGGWLGASGKAAATLGNTVLRSGIGAISGGKEGAISGALSGLTSSGVGSDIGKKIGLEGATAKIAGDAILGGAAGEATGVGFQQGATGQALASLAGNPYQKMEAKMTEMGRDIFNPMEGEFDVTPGSMSIDPSLDDPFGYGSELLPQTAVGDPGDLTGLGGGAPSGAVLAGAPPDPSIWETSKQWMKDHPWLTAGGAVLGAGALGLFDTPEEQGPPDFSTGLPPGFGDDLPNLSFDRELMPIEDYYNYGRASAESPGEQMFFSNNVIPSTSGPLPADPGAVGPGGPGRGGRGGGGRGRDVQVHAPGTGVGGFGTPSEVPLGNRMVPFKPMNLPGGLGGMATWAYAQQAGWTKEGNTIYPPGWTHAAQGGYVDGYHEGGYAEYKLGGLVRKYQSGGHVRGPGSGRSDDIPAVLSDGEYVIDSESVALLGDGSTDAGARRLDEMRKKLRKHKAKKLAKGGFSDPAKDPELYMQEGGYVPPKENPYKPGTARYKLWERKYGKGKDKDKKEKPPKKDQLTKKEQKEMLERAKRLKTRTERELDKLGEKAEGGNVNKSALMAVKRLANKLEFAVTSGNKKRVKQIANQLKSLEGGSAIEGFAHGGLVRNLTDSDIKEIADDLGGFKNDRAFMRKFKARIREESARRG